MKIIIPVLCSSIFAISAHAQQPLKAWGDNMYGSLGDGSSTARNTPVVIGTDNWTAVDGGSFFSVGIKSNGTLWTWGDQSEGQLGNGSTTGTPTGVQTPTQIGTDNDWTTLSCGDGFTLALKNNGTLWTWGDSKDYGTGNSIDVYVPTQLGTATWKYVSGGSSHSLGIQSDGSLWAWGDNNNGKLGEGTTTDHTTPVQIGTATDWKMVVAGNNSSFGIKTDGSLWQWGKNTVASGNLMIPTQVGTAIDWKLVHSSEGSHFAIKNDGTLWAWGVNAMGQLGLGNTNSPVTTLTQVGTDTDWEDVDGGYSHAIALKTTHTLWSMGMGAALGFAATLGVTVPTQIGTDNTWMAVSSGRVNVLALGGSVTRIGDVVHKTSFAVFPNPAEVSIQVNNQEPIKHIQITNMTGQILYSGNDKTINVALYPPGVYSIKAQLNNKEVIRGTFIKK
jgi:alpha-tubulin suppressor-like RCC1 family protein